LRCGCHMSDLLALALTTVFFGLSWAYIHVCERL
jgi:hypothetical protein